MLTDILNVCNDRITAIPQCCKTDGSACNCVDSLHKGFYDEPDSFSCEKKLATYVLRYGPAYATEIYRYLVATNFQQRINMTRPLNVCSLGCGFSPDYFAIKQYLNETGFKQPVNYIGFDRSPDWQNLRLPTKECTYCSKDLTKPFSFPLKPDIVVVGKLFSTLYRNDRNAAKSFLDNLKTAAQASCHAGTKLIFIDINLGDFGRDVFHAEVSTFLRNRSQHYFDCVQTYREKNWIPIPQEGLAFNIPSNLAIKSLQEEGKTVIFEYELNS